MKNDIIIAQQFFDKVSPLLLNARKSIDIIVFDWRWYAESPMSECQKFNLLILRAVKRGVRIRAVVNSQEIFDKLRLAGVQVKKYRSTHLLHAKLMIIDDESVLIGSHNYTQSAMTSNHEISVILSEIDNIDLYNSFFFNIWQS